MNIRALFFKFFDRRTGMEKARANVEEKIVPVLNIVKECVLYRDYARMGHVLSYLTDDAAIEIYDRLTDDEKAFVRLATPTGRMTPVLIKAFWPLSLVNPKRMRESNDDYTFFPGD